MLNYIWKAETLKDLFNSIEWYEKRGLEKDYHDLAFYLNNKVIEIEVINYKKAKRDKRNKVYKGLISTNMNESKTHLDLKWYAYNLLKKLGSKDIRFERRCGIGIADVYSKDLNICVECGSTPPNKVIDGFKNNVFDSIILFPALDENKCVKFKCNSKGRKIINLVENIKLNSIEEKIEKALELE